MIEDQIQEIILRILRGIAPEADLKNIDPSRRYRDQFSFDSVDFLSYASALQDEFKIQIPELDYPELATLKSCVSYLMRRMTPSGAPTLADS